MAVLSSYEQRRLKQLEENKRKLEELKLRHISASFNESISPPKRSPAKAVKRNAPEPGTVRRSERVASLPERPKYQDVGLEIIPRKRRRSGHSTRKDLVNRVYATDEEREYAINKATELEESLGSEFPTFVKPMTQSHVTGGFWLGLPTDFCRAHLPNKDTHITLIDEDDEEFTTLYLANKRGLSAQWRNFSIEHELVDGDAVVFQKTSSTTLKVYIIRKSGYHDQ